MKQPAPGEEQTGSDPAKAEKQTGSDPAPALQPSMTRREARQIRLQTQRHPWLRRGAIVLASVLTLVLVLGVVGYFKFNANITPLDVSGLLGQRPQNAAPADRTTNLKPLNILVMGSDTRALGTREFGTTEGARSDTTLIVHLAGDRRSAVVVSIPRDSMTRAPRDCNDPKGKVTDGPLRQWNANFSLGGPACVIRTVEGNTGVFIDHFMVLNFVGFESMVDALGTVEVCLPKAVDDADSKLHLPAGRTRVSGKDALSFVRLRNVGNGSDLSRINRQQAFLSAMVQEATSSSLLLRPDKLFRLLDAATKSLTTDPPLGNLNALREVAQSVAGLKSSQVRFVTVPNEAYPPKPLSQVQWTSAADGLWEAIAKDRPLPGSKPEPGPTPKDTSPTPVLTVRPDEISVHLKNASGVTGMATQAADDLRIQGFKTNKSTTGSDLKRGVTVAYSSANLEEARTVAAAFPGSVLVKDEAAGKIIEVTLGAGSPNVVEVPNRLGTTPLPKHTSSTPPPAPIKARTADSDICSPS